MYNEEGAIACGYDGGTVVAASIDRLYSLVLPLSARLLEVFCNLHVIKW